MRALWGLGDWKGVLQPGELGPLPCADPSPPKRGGLACSSFPLQHWVCKRDLEYMARAVASFLSQVMTAVSLEVIWLV